MRNLVIFSILTLTATFGQGNSGRARLTGKIEALPATGTIGNWTVAGRTVQVTAQTRIDTDEGRAIVGACVDVKGTPVGATTAIAATEIDVKEASKCAASTTPPGAIEIEGRVEQLPPGGLTGDWRVAGTVVRVTAQTKIEQEGGPVAVGSCAEVQGTRNSDGSLAAAKIETRSGTGGCENRGGGAVKPQIEFRGTVQTAPAQGSSVWVIAGRRVNVTNVRGRELTVGLCVEVEGRLESDGSITASRVQTLGSGVCQNGLDRQEDLQFRGLIASLPSGGLIGDWRVASLTVRVTAETRIENESGAPAVGVCVQVRGDFTAAGVAATRIETKPAAECQSSQAGVFRFDGLIQTIPTGGGLGTWQIGGRNVIADANTAIDRSKGATVIGACVSVTGALETSGAVRATRIEVLSASGSCIVTGGVVGAATLSGFGVSPAQIISVFGRNIGPATTQPLAIVNGSVSNQLANTRVLFDGTPATLLFASQGQINAIVPCNVAGKTTVSVQVESNGAWTNVVSLPVYASNPSLFTQSNSGRGPGAILNLENGVMQLNTPANGAPRGGTAILYGTGEGQTNPPCVDGQIVPAANPLPRPVLPVSVEVGGKAATVLYAGGAPGLVRGVVQVNITLAPDTPTGPNVPVTLKIGDRVSQDGVTMAVK